MDERFGPVAADQQREDQLRLTALSEAIRYPQGDPVDNARRFYDFLAGDKEKASEDNG